MNAIVLNEDTDSVMITMANGVNVRISGNGTVELTDQDGDSVSYPLYRES